MITTSGPPLWEHQLNALAWIHHHRGSLLWIPMGGGKSRIIVDYIQSVKSGLSCGMRVLIICPLKAVNNVWEQEFAKYAHSYFQYVFYPLSTGSCACRAEMLSRPLTFTLETTLVVATNYEALSSAVLSAKLLEMRPWDIIVFDESHRLKAPGGIQSRKAALLTRNAKRVIALSGTPMSQGPVDIYAQGRAIDPNVFGSSVQRFKDEFCVFGPSGQDARTGKQFPTFLSKQIQGYKNMDVFNKRLGSFTYHVEPAVCEAALPEITDCVVPIVLPKHVLDAYRLLENESVAMLGDMELTVSNALSLQLRLSQVTAGYWGHDYRARQCHTAKIDAILELLSETDESFVIFCRFRAEIDGLETAIRAAGRSTFRLMGGFDQLADWKASPGACLLVQIAAGAEAVSFIEARYQIYSSSTWSYSQYQQSRKRIWRHGQTRPVTLYHLIAQGSVDEDVYSALSSKSDVVESIRDGLRRRQTKG